MADDRVPAIVGGQWGTMPIGSDDPGDFIPGAVPGGEPTPPSPPEPIPPETSPPSEPTYPEPTPPSEPPATVPSRYVLAIVSGRWGFIPASNLEGDMTGFIPTPSEPSAPFETSSPQPVLPQPLAPLGVGYEYAWSPETGWGQIPVGEGADVEAGIVKPADVIGYKPAPSPEGGIQKAGVDILSPEGEKIGFIGYSGEFVPSGQVEPPPVRDASGQVFTVDKGIEQFIQSWEMPSPPEGFEWTTESIAEFDEAKQKALLLTDISLRPYLAVDGEGNLAINVGAALKGGVSQGLLFDITGLLKPQLEQSQKDYEVYLANQPVMQAYKSVLMEQVRQEMLAESLAKRGYATPLPDRRQTLDYGENAIYYSREGWQMGYHIHF
jgi:hypothetical protein